MPFLTLNVSFILSSYNLTFTASSKLSTFERHLHEQAVQHGISPRQTPTALRSAIAEALRQKLSNAGASTEGTLTQLRTRWRLVELLNVARDQGIQTQGRTLEAVKEDVLGALRSKLRSLEAPTHGSVFAMTRRIQEFMKRQERKEKAL